MENLTNAGIPTTATRPAHPRLPQDLDDWTTWVEYGLAWAATALAPEVHAAREQTRPPVSTAPRERQAPLPPQSTPRPSWTPSTSRRDGRTIELIGYREPTPGPRWQALFRATWPAYRAWYTSEGTAARPSLAEASARLQEHMPELVDTWRRLVDLTGGDEMAARLLTMWRMPAYVSGCSQVTFPGESPALVRNYDYDPALFEGVVASTDYSGRRKVIGTSDLLWGLLDGMNSDGLAVSLTFGGRPYRGSDAPGFGIPIVLRYLLETCADVGSAVATLRRLPVAQAYNIALVDTRGAHASVFVAPGEEAVVSDLRVTTNHRLDEVEHPHIAERLDSTLRQGRLEEAAILDARAAIGALLSSPLRRTDYAGGFGTLYTVSYRPDLGEVTYHWPGTAWCRRFGDGEARIEAWASQN